MAVTLAYQLSDLIPEVQRRENDTSFSSTEILNYLNDSQREIVSRHTFPFMEKVVDGPLTIGEATYDVQADHDVTLDAYIIDPNDTTQSWGLTFIPSDEFFTRYPNPDVQDNNQPTCWTLFAENITFNCPPDKAYTFRQRYYKIAEALVDSTDVPVIPERFKEVLIRGALSRVEERRDNFDFAAIHKNEFEQQLADMAQRVIPQTYGQPGQLRTARSRSHGTF